MYFQSSLHTLLFFGAFFFFTETIASSNAASGVPVPDENPFFVKFDTSEGVFIVEVSPSWSPRGAERFLQLVGAKYFDGQRIFRVIPKFLVQFGYSGDPALTKEFGRQHIIDDPFKVSNYRGYVAFAGSSKDSRSTNIFINLVDNFFIDHRDVWATPFGRVVTGFESVEKFYAGYQRLEQQGGQTPNQGRIAAQGDAYLDENFPLLSRINSAKIIQMPLSPSRAISADVGHNPAPPPKLVGVTNKPFPKHWKDAPNLNPTNREDDVIFPHDYGHGSREVAKWIRLNERMDVIAERDRTDDIRKMLLTSENSENKPSSGGVRGKKSIESRESVLIDRSNLEAAALNLENKLEDGLQSAQKEIQHDSSVVLLLASIGLFVVVWFGLRQCNRLRYKTKD